jgi:hypothetical protein
MFSKVKLMRGHKTTQVFTNGHGYDRFYLLPSKCFSGKAFMAFIRDAGILQLLISNNSGEQAFTEFGNTCTKYCINRKYTVPHIPCANLAEASIREIKVGICKAMQRRKSPKRTWCYCGEWVAAIRRLKQL